MGSCRRAPSPVIPAAATAPPTPPVYPRGKAATPAQPSAAAGGGALGEYVLRGIAAPCTVLTLPDA